jgi:hypothetical protein
MGAGSVLTMSVLEANSSSQPSTESGPPVENTTNDEPALITNMDAIELSFRQLAGVINVNSGSQSASNTAEAGATVVVVAMAVVVVVSTAAVVVAATVVVVFGASAGTEVSAAPSPAAEHAVMTIVVPRANTRERAISRCSFRVRGLRWENTRLPEHSGVGVPAP